ncbi:Lipid-binding START domain-containing protein [Klebsormidium nitens]|uniref:Lipid-binding START domain-containing protein n=1 Tax=Klebsormidium nitens TaxID=105231 RepID=A0A1Y1I6C3_KLENI|nr:Lipid-binding START domain-containing protein [Klebsormidium nitens]|eukprot:GAQ86500.1 Lipid-binding START domain-containing protein [Klebsormidium nitens]
MLEVAGHAMDDRVLLASVKSGVWDSVLYSSVLPLWTSVAAGLVMGWGWRHRWLPLLTLVLQRPTLTAGATTPAQKRFWLGLTVAAGVPLLQYAWGAFSQRVWKGKQHSIEGADCRGRPEAPLTSASLASLVTEADLADFMRQLNGEDLEEMPWEQILDKTSEHLSYVSYRRDPRNGGPTQYLSKTTFFGCSPPLLRDFYMDDEYRGAWDSSLNSARQLALCNESGVEVGHWVKKLPLFGANRDYVLAWRVWEDSKGSFYCVTKACQHPFAPSHPSTKRIEVYTSSWRIRAVPSMIPGGPPSSEVTLVHQEDSGIQRDMAKMAIRRGAWNFVKKMGPALEGYTHWHATQRVSKESAVSLAHRLPEHLDPGGPAARGRAESSGAEGGELRRSASMRGSRRRKIALVAAGALLAAASGGGPALGAKVLTMVLPVLGRKLKQRGRS